MKNITTYNKYNFQKIFEGFTKEEFEKLKKEHKTYIETIRPTKIKDIDYTK